MIALTESDVERRVVDLSAKLAEPRGRRGIVPSGTYAPGIDDEWPRPARVPTLTLERPAYYDGRMAACFVGGVTLGISLGAFGLYVALRIMGGA